MYIAHACCTKGIALNFAHARLPPIAANTSRLRSMARYRGDVVRNDLQRDRAA